MSSTDYPLEEEAYAVAYVAALERVAEAARPWVEVLDDRGWEDRMRLREALAELDELCRRLE